MKGFIMNENENENEIYERIIDRLIISTNEMIENYSDEEIMKENLRILFKIDINSINDEDLKYDLISLIDGFYHLSMI